jgi:hypothetical protein
MYIQAQYLSTSLRRHCSQPPHRILIEFPATFVKRNPPSPPLPITCTSQFQNPSAPLHSTQQRPPPDTTQAPRRGPTLHDARAVPRQASTSRLGRARWVPGLALTTPVATSDDRLAAGSQRREWRGGIGGGCGAVPCVLCVRACLL